MKYPLIFILILLTLSKGFTQNSSEYSKLISEGWKLCLAKDFESSAEQYEKAFQISQDVPLRDRYNASCIYALANNKDKAFHHLFIIGNELKWTDHDHLISDTDLTSLHDDPRWEKLSSLIIQNKKEEEAHFDQEMVAVLDQIYVDDQSTRNKIRSTEEKFGRESTEMDLLWQDILKKDSINLMKVSGILNDKGWPDKNLIGERGTSTLFLVIQHANQSTQEKYLPLIQKATEDKNLPKRQYAMFYDRLLLNRGERQIYGTQLAMSKESKSPYVLPLESPENVDQRRVEMGLNTMQENLNRWNLTWDVEEYIQKLPEIEAKERELNNKDN
ncbi:DUF6624 domain-containing protein [Jiulongibacter sediminis]|jgi:hypothetical protein|uniref:DUF6624 domain-containing protein n=1 Tax=Jiulongibacter sediminis TaxID=1605367 RepID=UPI0026F37949|nr:DUF6624 domain-containing protein [Jiulongibacter sediminis]